MDNEFVTESALVRRAIMWYMPAKFTIQDVINKIWSLYKTTVDLGLILMYLESNSISGLIEYRNNHYFKIVSKDFGCVYDV